MPPGFVAAKPPRPATPVAGGLMLGGAVTIIIGTVLPWLSFGGTSINGFDEFIALGDNPFEAETQVPGPLFVFLAIVMGAFGITTLAAKRLLTIMIIGIVIGAFALLSAAVMWAHYNDYAVAGASLGAGLPIVTVGSAVTLAGAITGCAKRRNWLAGRPPPGPR